MSILGNFLPNFSEVFHIAYLVVIRYYGWVLFVIGLIYMLYFEYKEEVQAQFVASISWTFLEIHVPRENRTSTLAVENIFSQMHALHRSLTPMEKYVEGQFQMWYSLEIVSLGGRVAYIVRVPKQYRHLVESAFYSQYPNIEIAEVADYMENFQLDPYNNTGPYDFFGTELKMTEDSVIPIKTYKDFEHPSAEEKVIDPMVGTIEALERIAPNEVLALQILIQPIQNDEWTDKAERKIKELIEEEIPHKITFLGILLAPLNWFANLGRGNGKSHGGSDLEGRKPRNKWMNMTEGEKQRVALIEGKVNKANYQTKIRLLYIAPKDQYDKIKRFELVGSLRHLSPGGGAGIHNTLKTDKTTWTKVDALISPGLEKNYLDWETRRRKYWFLRGYKRRSTYVGSPKFLLSAEEIATLFHFPITTEGTQAPAGVAAVESKKVRAPANLPVAEMD